MDIIDPQEATFSKVLPTIETLLPMLFNSIRDFKVKQTNLNSEPSITSSGGFPPVMDILKIDFG